MNASLRLFWYGQRPHRSVSTCKAVLGSMLVCPSRCAQSCSSTPTTSALLAHRESRRLRQNPENLVAAMLPTSQQYGHGIRVKHNGHIMQQQRTALCVVCKGPQARGRA